MKINRLICGAGTLMTALLLVACKPSPEKLSEAEALKAALVEAKNNAENTYLDITDSSLRGTLDELIFFYDIIIMVLYMDLYKGKYFNVVFEDWCQEFPGSCIISGKKERLSDMTSDEYSANLLGDGITVAAGYTLVGVDLDIKIDSAQWEIVIKDDGGKAYSFVCGDFNQASREGIYITLSYDSTAGTGVADIQNQ